MHQPVLQGLPVSTEPLTYREVTAELFRGWVGEKSERLDASRSGFGAEAAIKDALTDEFGIERAAGIGFHLADWAADAAFLLALHLVPERFTIEQVDEGVRSLLIHIPNHVAAAAHLYKSPIQDIFEVGVQVEPRGQGAGESGEPGPR